MADNIQLTYAKLAYNTFCKALDDLGWRYNRHDDEFKIFYGVNGDDIKMNFLAIIDVDRQLIRLISLLPFEVNEDKRVECAVAVTAINYLLADGNFDCDVRDKHILFRLTATFRESIIDAELVKYLISISCNTVDRYNEKLAALNNGDITIGEFLDIINK